MEVFSNGPLPPVIVPLGARQTILPSFSTEAVESGEPVMKVSTHELHIGEAAFPTD